MGPPSPRVPGADSFWSTALWLRAAFSGLRCDIHHAVADGDLVAVNATMDGRGSRTAGIIEHGANRDDLGMARQLGWIPPAPAYLLKMARARRRARRS